MSVARVSLAVSVEHRERAAAPPPPAASHSADPETETVRLDPPDRPV
jgi:hypothetical protein